MFGQLPGVANTAMARARLRRPTVPGKGARANGRLAMSIYCFASKTRATTAAASKEPTEGKTGRLALLRGVCLTGACVLALPGVGAAATVSNPLCPAEAVAFNPSNGQDIVVPKGFKVSVFASGLNFPTGIAFVMKSDDGKGKAFEVYVLESGHGLPSRCND